MNKNLKQALSNRSLDRGISIMEALATRGASSLHELHLTTRLPKSTLRRLLGTLTDRNIVRRSLNDQRYRINVGLPIVRDTHLPVRMARFVEIALPHMIDLTRHVDWPSDLHFFTGEHMLIIESTRTLSPFSINRRLIDQRVNVFGAASGRAYLAELSHDSLVGLIRSIGHKGRWGTSRMGLSIDDILEDAEQTRATGYGTRRPNYDGELEVKAQLSAIAKPIFDGVKPIGALTVVWPPIYMYEDEFAAHNLNHLENTAAIISKGLSAKAR